MMQFTGKSSVALQQFEQDLAAFLLVRSEFAWLGFGWGGCDRAYARPPLLDSDFGRPMELCKESATGSGVFSREWTRATVSLDTNSNTANITMKR